MPSPVSTGSPLRYDLPGLSVVLGTTLTTLPVELSGPQDRPWLADAAACAFSGVVAATSMVRAVSPHLLVAGQRRSRSERDRLRRTRFCVNALRLFVTAGA
jgi:hypothetical protein